VIRSDRLKLRNWRESDRDAFAGLNAAPEVTQDLGGPLDRSESDAKFDRYVAAFDQRGFCRWALEDLDGQFLGYTGVMPSRPVIGAGRCHSRRTRQFRGAEFAASGRAVFGIADDLGSTTLEAFYGAGNTDLPACPQIGCYLRESGH